MPDPIGELIRLEVRLAGLTRDWSERTLSAPPEGAPDATIWCDYGFKWPAYALVHLHRTQHADNPLHGQDWCVDLALRLIDKCVDDWRYRADHGLSISSREVPHYIAATLLEWLGGDVDGQRRAAWTAHAEAWAHQASRRPFGFTGNYHDAWRFLSLYRLGQALDRPEWSRTARYFFHRMIALQTEEGFWEEGRHHGPSMRYNGLMLPTLAWMYRLADDELCGRAARRLADFMATYTYPDAITVGPFDGRNSPMLAFFPTCAGLELTERGRVLSARAFRLWRELGAPAEPWLAVESTRDAVRLAFYAADTCVYLSEHVPPDERAAAVDESGRLPVDVDGTVEHHTTTFDGLLHRRGPWVLALSGQNSDIPRQSRNIYRLERQSRIELWHRDARLVLGGGHNLRESDIPYANALLDTGYAGPAEFGRIDIEQQRRLHEGYSASRAGGAIPASPDARGVHNLFQAYYMPRVARTGAADGSAAAELTLVFGHGTVRFRFDWPTPQRCRIDAAWDVLPLERLCLQLPVVVWSGARLSLDGVEQPADGRPTEALELKNELRVDGGPFASHVGLHVPRDVPCRVHYPLAPQPTFSDHFPDDLFRPQFAIALVSCQWSQPRPGRGQARFVVTVEAAERG